MSRDFFKKSLVVLWVTWKTQLELGIGYMDWRRVGSVGALEKFTLRVLFVGNVDFRGMVFLVARKNQHFFFCGGGVLEMKTMSQVRCLLSEWFRLLIRQVWNVPVVVLLSRCIFSSSNKYVYI